VPDSSSRKSFEVFSNTEKLAMQPCFCDSCNFWYVFVPKCTKITIFTALKSRCDSVLSVCICIQSNTKGGSSSLNEDTLGSQLKSGIAQYIALEIARGNGRDHRAITRYLPWLYHPPSAMQQG
jgi:hypothetical protein